MTKSNSWSELTEIELKLEATHREAQEFAEKINEERRNGYGFVPLIGAGFSAPSGAPLVWDIKAYLERCICMALGVEDPVMHPWNPRTDQWPPFIDRNRPEPVDWYTKVDAEFQRRRRRGVWDRELPIFQEALGAMAEWRSALSFLSRVVRYREDEADGVSREYLAMDAPRQDIIDACVREIMRDKHPTLGHRMLAVLAGALRLDIVLTTNFDDLLERAFAKVRNPLEVFEVQLNSSLPHWSAVTQVRSLVKLHGSKHLLRADYTLDALPSELDKQRFLEYLLSAKGRSDLAARVADSSDLDFQNHLLVIGFSGEDRRIRSLLEHAWRKLGSDFKVFWLCYSENDVTNIRKFVMQSERRLKHQGLPKGDQGLSGRVHILRHTEAGLFLLYLYQKIRRNLPPLGSVFPSMSRLAIPPEAIPTKGDPAPTEDFCKRLIKQLADFEDERFDRLEPERRRHRLVVVTGRGKDSEKETPGLTSACGKVFWHFASDHICLWLDMNDIASTDNLFEVLLEAAYFKLGLESWSPTYLATDAGTRANEMQRLVTSANKRWIIFLNARETPGANTSEGDLEGNGWLDKQSRKQTVGLMDASDCAEAFIDLITALCGPESSRISVVLICRHEKTDPPLLKALKNSGLATWSPPFCSKPKNHTFDETAIVRRTLAEFVQSDAKLRFLHALVLMQRPRFLASIWSKALSQVEDNNIKGLGEPISQEEEWLKKLVDFQLIRYKVGGFIWIQSRCREKLRTVLQDPTKHNLLDLDQDAHVIKTLQEWSKNNEEAEIHEELAKWYEKVLDASGSTAAAFEVVYHLCKAAVCHVTGTVNLAELEAIKSAGMDLGAATSLLRRNSFLIQTHGYSRGSCRRLEYIRDTLCGWIAATDLEESKRNLQLACTEVMRAIAREVGEDAKAYWRHRQIAALMRNIPVAGDKGQDETIEANSEQLRLTLSKIGESACWLRWCRWSGMLAIASRSYHSAESVLRKALFSVTSDLAHWPEGVGGRIDWAHLSVGQFLLFKDEETSDRTRIEVLRLIQQYVELCLLRYGAARRLNDFLPKTEPSITIEKIQSHIEAGRKLAALIRSHDNSPDSHVSVMADWCESRLLMHLSVCATHDGREKIGSRQTAMAVLGDAEANLRISDPRRYQLELAMVELHRAEARMHEAASVPFGNGIRFASVCRELEVVAVDGDWHENGNLWMAKFGVPSCDSTVDPDREKNTVDPDRQKNLRRIRAFIDDSLRFLNRAQSIMQNRRRHVWWTTWFFERKLRAIAFSVWASVFEVPAAEFETPIPFLGLEAAMRKTSTEADLLLNDAIRMIRVDAYRLATIIDAYASSAKALRMKTTVRQKHAPDLLPGRQKDMQEQLERALVELDKVLLRREDRKTELYQRGSELDEHVQSYIGEVRKRVKCITEQLKNPHAMPVKVGSRTGSLGPIQHIQTKRSDE